MSTVHVIARQFYCVTQLLSYFFFSLTIINGTGSVLQWFGHVESKDADQVKQWRLRELDRGDTWRRLDGIVSGLQVTSPKGYWSDIYVECNNQVNIITW